MSSAESPGRIDSFLLVAVNVLSVLAVLLVCIVIVGRIGYPYELEWMEGGTLEHALRLARGESIYVEPSLDWTANVYAPLYYYVVAAAVALSEPVVAVGRLVSVVAWIACLVLLARAAGARSRWVALVAAGAYASVFEFTLGWIDLVRVDSLFVLLLVAALLRVRNAQTFRQDLAAGLLFALAALTKQTAIIAVLPIVVWKLVVERGWRRLSLLGAFVVGVALPTLILHWNSHGWSTFYTIELPRHLRGDRGLRPEFLWVDLIAVLPVFAIMAIVGLVLRWRNGDSSARLDSVILASAILAGWASRLDPLSYENALLPTFAVIAWFSAEGLAVLRGQGLGRGLFAIASVAIAAQLLFFSFDPRQHWPDSHDRAAGDTLVQRIRAIEGPVLVPYHGQLAPQAGKAASAHMSAMADIMRCSDEELVRRFRGQLAERIASKHYAAIITDGRFMLNTIRDNYRDGGELFADPEVFVPVEGQAMRPQRIFLR